MFVVGYSVPNTASAHDVTSVLFQSSVCSKRSLPHAFVLLHVGNRAQELSTEFSKYGYDSCGDFLFDVQVFSLCPTLSQKTLMLRNYVDSGGEVKRSGAVLLELGLPEHTFTLLACNSGYNWQGVQEVFDWVSPRDPHIMCFDTHPFQEGNNSFYLGSLHDNFDAYSTHVMIKLNKLSMNTLCSLVHFKKPVFHKFTRVALMYKKEARVACAQLGTTCAQTVTHTDMDTQTDTQTDSKTDTQTETTNETAIQTTNELDDTQDWCIHVGEPTMDDYVQL